MYDFYVSSSGNIEFNIDLNIYPDVVVSKVLYCIAADFSIESQSISSTTRHIVLVPKEKTMSADKYSEYQCYLSQLFADFKVRELVRQETEAIRNILYLKAFANYSELEDLRGEE